MTWQDRALCAQVGGDYWYPEKNEPHLANAAKRVCRACPVRVECLDWAMTNEDQFAILGGVTARERRRMRRRRRATV